MLDQSTNVVDQMGGLIMHFILGASLLFITFCVAMTSYMLRRRRLKNTQAVDDGILISRYQDFLSNFLILPIDESFIGISTSNQLSSRLDTKDISDPHRRTLLANEIYDLKKQLSGQQAIQLNNYFFGLGLQEEVLKMLADKKWSNIVRAMQMSKSFHILECLETIDTYINHENKELSIHAITTRLDFDQNISILAKVERKLNNWEWHKIYHEIKRSKLAEIDFTRLLENGLQDPKSIQVIKDNLEPKQALEPILVKILAHE